MDAKAAAAATYRVQDTSVVIRLSMALTSMHDPSRRAGEFLYEALGMCSHQQGPKATDELERTIRPCSGVYSYE